ncbi:MAG TPA: chemotaxis response regulator protein-glutamate methylesterase [Candidatus Syntrophoarchaeum butanivorans]|uniref:Protein-glutamate methylesterase/protein-glutamine glutaminase n=2 Tax=Candidatus Syntropharchaeum butanivorans TaxID=1839936 RepID=A0A1F2P592_9EURY|nr:MAG: chemotaxis-specific methylesterase [Candidatus Syntrophoarchaeum butanivorans]RJS70544.1 MAG: chemotaxis response regulator protein-glutamate methylesterase [Candidatus Syntrophoarchaeum sp. WYZ-LMO15]HDM36570.1 chemotaxis response regulator protein-glutamate methylesterase [Candidatus Syntrophoarchaeum butanivorans]HEC56594.1 chemotaxis response regulator protein-glutamate methylesterase [Candidatus Syntrophoarchaeum butanivorans]
MIRVLVVDDSALMRKVISDILSSAPDIEVAGTAKDGVEAIEKVARLKPDVITLDIEMPEMDGLEALEFIMKDCPTPTVMISALTQEGAEATFRALELGAVDFVAKPSGSISLDMKDLADEVIRKVRAAHLSRRVKRRSGVRKPLQSAPSGFRIITIGSSTGGTEALKEIVPQFPKNSPPILITQHMPPGFTEAFAEHLDRISAIKVKEAEEGDRIMKGLALLAPGDYHMTVGGDRRVHLEHTEKINSVRPAADPMMMSAAVVYRRAVIGVVLTGMGRDGARGIVEIKKRGGKAIAQSEDTCVVYGMPKEAVATGCVDEVVPLPDIPSKIMEWC